MNTATLVTQYKVCFPRNESAPEEQKITCDLCSKDFDSDKFVCHYNKCFGSKKNAYKLLKAGKNQRAIRWANKAFKYFKILIIKLEHIPVKVYNTAPPPISQEMR